MSWMSSSKRLRYPGDFGLLKRPKFLNILSPTGAHSSDVRLNSKRDQGFDGVGLGEGLYMTRSKSPAKTAVQNRPPSMKPSRTSMPTARMLRTAMRTIDSQSVQPLGDVMNTVGTRLPLASRVST